VPWLARALNASPRVVEAFMHARAIWHRSSVGGIAGGIAMLKQALEWDPRYAPGHAALGALYTMMAWWGQGWPRELGPTITAAATRALELDPNNGAAVSTLAYVRSLIDWRPDEADRLFAKAIAIDPSSPIVPSLRACHLVAQTRFREAVESAAAALELDPFSLALNSGFAAALRMSRRYPEALEAARRTVELDPSHGPGYGSLALALQGLGRRGDALAAARKWVALTPDAPDARAGLAYTLAAGGQRAEAGALLARARGEASTRYVVPSTFAAAALAAGSAEDAFAWLDLAVAQRCCFLGPILADPRLNPIRDDARYRRLAAMLRGPAAPGPPRPARRIAAGERRAAR
jgi:tetratricopeptide (TPR) repeat protein